ncbi:hypothetical protein EGW08_014988 [Elysia chlorotica]|uniref:Uncharacterized protein n=1 Tax=Elysia chlorotica TaxID=188477 RepID=A0A3S0ZWV5_ELYCH|nr:hypothetical protein EGW08_014988 [Elysia chlorotica]
MAAENPDHGFRRPSNPDKKKRVAKKYVGLNDEEIEKKRLRNNELSCIVDVEAFNRTLAAHGNFGNLDVGFMVRNIGYGGSQNQAHVEGNQQTNKKHDNSFTAMTHASLNHNHSSGLPAMNHASVNHNHSSGLPAMNHASLNHNLSSGLPVMNHASLNHTNGSLFMSHVNQNIRVDPMISNNQSIVQTFDNHMNSYSGNCPMNHSRGTGFEQQTSYTITNAATVASSVSPSGSLSASSNQDSGFGTPSSDSPDGSSSRLPGLSPDPVSRALSHL